MKIYQKCLSGHASAKCHLTPMFRNKIFPPEKNVINHPVVFLNNLPINTKSTEKHLRLLLDGKLNFSEHINEKLKKVTKTNNVLRKLNLTLSLSLSFSFLSKEKWYQELGFQSLKDRQWMRKFGY